MVQKIDDISQDSSVEWKDVPEQAQGLEIDFIDFIAIFLALLQTVFLPILVIFGVLVVIALFIGLFL